VEVHAKTVFVDLSADIKAQVAALKAKRNQLKNEEAKLIQTRNKLMHKAVARKKMVGDTMKATGSSTESVGTTATGENNDETMICFMQFVISTTE
jgi:ribosomal protein L10